MKMAFTQAAFAFLFSFCNLRLSCSQSVIGHAPTPWKELDPSPYIEQPATVQTRATPSSTPVYTLTAHSSTPSPSIKLEKSFTAVSPSPILTKHLSNGISPEPSPTRALYFSTFPDSPTAQTCPFPSPEYFSGRYQWLPRSFERRMTETKSSLIRFQFSLGVERMEDKLFFFMSVHGNRWIRSAGILFFIGDGKFSYISQNYPKISEYSKSKTSLYRTKLLKKVYKPRGEKCCKNQITIYVHIRICRYGRCEVLKKQYKNKLRCRAIRFNR